MSKIDDMLDNNKQLTGADKKEVPVDTKKEDVSKVTPQKSTKKETVEMDKEEFDSLVKRLTRLEKTANKARLSNYDKSVEEDQETILKLRTIDGKVIISWSNMTKNVAEVDPVTRRIVEDQKAVYEFDDGTSEEMSIIVFNKRYKYLYVKIVEERTQKKAENIEKYGNRIFIVEDVENGKTYEIGENFVN